MLKNDNTDAEGDFIVSLDDFVLEIEKWNEVTERIQADWDKAEILSNFSVLEYDGVIKRYETTFIAAFDIMDKYLKYQGVYVVGGPKSILIGALKINLIEKGGIWNTMFNCRFKVHNRYSKETTEEVFLKIVTDFVPQFLKLHVKVNELSDLIFARFDKK